MTNTQKLLEAYLTAIGIEGFRVIAHHDPSGFVIIAEIPRANNERIGYLKGKLGRNISTLNSMLNIVGLAEGIKPLAVIRLVD